MMGIRAIALAVAAASLVFLVATAYTIGQHRADRRAAVRLEQVGSELLTERARADTTRLLFRNSLRQAFERLSEQAEIFDADTARIARAARSAIQTSSTYRLALDAFRDSVAAAVQVVDDDVREATFHVERPEAVVTAAVRLPPPPADGHINVTVAVQPFTIVPWVECGDLDPVTRLRPVLNRVDVPAWVAVTIADARADPDVCNPRPQPIPFGTKVRIGSRYAVGGALAGAAITLFLMR